MVVLNTKTGEIIFRPRFTEPVDLNWTTSYDAGHGDYIVKVVQFLTPKVWLFTINNVFTLLDLKMY